MQEYTSDLRSRHCIICGGNELILLSSNMRPGPQLNTVVCKTCSLVFTNPVPSEDVYYSFYTNDYEHYYGKSTASKPQSVKAPAVFSILERFIELKSSHYLEIGPGRGLTLFHAHKLFKHAKGVEPSIDFVNTLVTKYNLNVVNNTFEGFMAGPKDTVDVVGMFHVLEHIYDPYKGLMSIREILRDNGLVVIEVPNILKPFRHLDTYFLRFVHLYNFSPASLKQLLTKCGFDVLYEEDGAHDWNSPQNITVIARKSGLVTGSVKVEREGADKVIEALNQYRLLYNRSLRYKWFLFDKTRVPLKFLRRVRNRIKVFLSGSAMSKS